MICRALAFIALPLAAQTFEVTPDRIMVDEVAVVHAAGRPEIIPEWLGDTVNRISGRENSPGGTPKGNAESALDAIPKVLAFLQKSLGEPVTKAQ